MCFGGSSAPPVAPLPPPPPAPPPPAPPQTVEPTKPPAATPAPEATDVGKKATLKQRETGTAKRERLRTGTTSLQTAPGTGLNISANVSPQQQ